MDKLLVLPGIFLKATNAQIQQNISTLRMYHLHADLQIYRLIGMAL